MIEGFSMGQGEVMVSHLQFMDDSSGGAAELRPACGGFGLPAKTSSIYLPRVAS